MLQCSFQRQWADLFIFLDKKIGSAVHHNSQKVMNTSEIEVMNTSYKSRARVGRTHARSFAKNELCLRHLQSSVQPRSNGMVMTDESIILDTGVATTVSRSTATTQLTKNTSAGKDKQESNTAKS